MNELDLAWAAGLFEGEGTVTIAVRNSDDTYRLLCIIGNTDRQIIEFFHHAWSGWLHGVYGHRPNRKPAWTWTVAGPRAEAFIRAIAPYIKTTRVQDKIRIALRFRERQSSLKREWSKADYRPAQRALYQRMRELNQRGLPAASVALAASEPGHG